MIAGPAAIWATSLASVSSISFPFLAAEMMDDETSLTLFVLIIGALAVAAVIAVPAVIRRLPISKAVPALALIGPLLAVIGSLVGSGAMTLSGHDIGYVLLVSAATGAAAIIVGWRLASPLARDLDVVGKTVAAIASGDRTARTDIDRPDELGELASTVDQLGQSLQRAEVEREVAEQERLAVVSALSHDLRTPLASLLASVDALEDGIADGPSHLRAMRRNVLALERLIEDLFLLARADSGALALQAESLDLAELIDEALEAIGPTAAERNVQLSARLSSAIPVLGDDTALGRVLRNLLDNAVRHVPDGGAVAIVTECSAGDDGGPARVDLRVVDNGPGFPADFVSRAFERFTQADSARSRQGGAGLGLAIAHTLVEAHDGTISIREPGPGDVLPGSDRIGGDVCITLPLLSAPVSVNS